MYHFCVLAYCVTHEQYPEFGWQALRVCDQGIYGSLVGFKAQRLTGGIQGGGFHCAPAETHAAAWLKAMIRREYASAMGECQ